MSSQPSLRRRMTARELARLYAAAFGLIAFTSAVAALVGSHLAWNRTASVPLGLYWISRGAPLTTGSLVAFPVPANVADLVRERRYLPPGALLLKRVAAMPGDHVCMDGRELRVNDRPLGPVLTADSLGRPLPHDERCGALAPGEVFVATDHAKSFDSRTFGPVRADSVRGTVRPLWTY